MSGKLRATEAPWTAARQTSGLTSRLILAYAERAGGRAAVDAILERCGLSEYLEELRDESFWFDFETKVRLFAATAEVLGDPDAARHIGAAAVDIGVFTGLKLVMRAFGAPRIVYSTIPRHAWKFTSTHRLELFELKATRARFQYADVSGVGYDRLDCEYNIGLLQVIPTMFGRPYARVDHVECALRGAQSCIYDVQWEEGAGAVRRSALRWSVAATTALAGTASLAPRRLRIAGAVPALGASVVARKAVVARRHQRRALENEVRDQKELAERLSTSLRDLVSDLRVDEVLLKIIKNAQDTVPGREFALLVLTEGGFQCRSSSRVPETSLRALEAWASETPEVVEDKIALDTLASVEQLGDLPADKISPLGALYSAPLIFRNERLGALVALAHGADGFFGQERGVMDAYADQAALALANARLFAQLEEHARRDSLTGLLNRRQFHHAVSEELERAEHYGHPVSLVVFDLDGFKEVNDERGHAEGDGVLRMVSGVLSDMTPASGEAYRLGGDEFALLLPQLSAARGRTLASQIEDAVAALGVGVTACSGLAVWPEDGPTENLLLFNADRALYEEKSHRNRGRSANRSEPAMRRRRHVLEPREGEGEDERDRHLKTVTRALARAVDAKDSYTRSHCETVSQLCGVIAEQLRLAPERVASIRLAGLLHDVGKIGIPDAVLQKPSALTDEEFEVMKSHSTLGYTIVLGADLPREAEWVLRHHERPDGRGYPGRLSGDEVPLESRIILVADAFEAMTSDRPYRRGRPTAEALGELERCAGSQFDAECVSALRRGLGTGAAELFTPGPSLTRSGSRPVSP
ncbi:MAG: hypothetical protein NVSMB25_22720 [Thermoleophilaceae bacterium]